MPKEMENTPLEFAQYLDTFKLLIGTKVTIKECHARPEVNGKKGAVMGWVNPSTFGYPLMVYLDEPVYFQMGNTGLAVPFQGPHFCRADELLVDGIAGIPDIFNWDDKENGDAKKI
jgi:hypothetical protein